MEWTGLASLLTSAAVGGAVGIKVLEFALGRFTRRSDSKQAARDLLARHLDPLLKSADDLAGKIRSLADTDFSDFRRKPSRAKTATQSLRRMATMYVFAQFWARVQLLRIESASATLGSMKAGSRLLNFIYELESQRVRVLDRAWQRAGGDATMIIEGASMRPMTLYEFITRYEASQEFRRWFLPLANVLDHTSRAENRQLILKYGVVLHALINSLDREHVVTRKREPWGNKLDLASKRELQRRVFAVHLPFVRDPISYTQPRKKRARRAVLSKNTATSPLGLD